MAAVRRVFAALASAVLLTTPALAQPIDRQALVSRHNVTLSEIDPHAPLMVGNGDLGFTADITGLQTFPEQYSKLAPLLTMAQWSWHSFPDPKGYTEADGLTQVEVPGRGSQPYAWMRSWSEAEKNPAFTWLRANPHRFSLGRISLELRRRNGRPAAFADLSRTSQTLDLWTGALTSRFVFEGQPVTVETRVLPEDDVVLVEIRSPLVAQKRLGVSVRCPYVTDAVNGDPSDWSRPERHATTVLSRTASRWVLGRKLDDTTYASAIEAPNAAISADGPHGFRVMPARGDRLVVAVAYAPQAEALKPVALSTARTAVTETWRSFWSKGGMVDFTGSTDPRAAELERRVVLSQYLSALNGTGELPPQEEGLFSNSWYGKFHLEMPVWHSGWFAAWGRPEKLQRMMGWYAAHLPEARKEAARHKVEGAWWPKMSGPEGRNSPSTINPFIMWQQPHPIYLAELLYRAQPSAETLQTYGEVVDQTARLLASWPLWDGGKGRYVLGPPIIPVQENHPPLSTINPTFEVEYFRWGLQTAQAWRQRRGLPREPKWDEVIARMSPAPQQDGLYLPVESGPDFWKQAATSACRTHATGECLNRDHPSFLMAYGLIGADRIDPETMRRTFRATEDVWDIRQTWGWDFPMIAMTAARLGEPEKAVDWLFADLKNNQWGVSGMTPRVHLDEHADAFTPTASADVGPDGPGYRRAAETYFPSNGSLLLAVGMMAAGWEGSKGAAPGFPQTGWKVRAEGIRPLP
ncbi:hypothetical protein [Phenylobacterium deserti]|uniref:Glycoside hydrolase family 65 n=1 Tax=Phenylobacterium deserti TaxID=1914756 RepID=A0A328ADM6_9CAUL|nr:hypothetical protein [Phenylobacterium deserti]RAK50828.1 hypothetical protein DJ018_16785 [Phenylobacterium deserti]